MRVVISSVVARWYFYSVESIDEKEKSGFEDESDDDVSDYGIPTTRLLSSLNERMERGQMTDSAIAAPNIITMLSIVECGESVAYKNMGSILFAAAVLCVLEGIFLIPDEKEPSFY